MAYTYLFSFSSVELWEFFFPSITLISSIILFYYSIYYSSIKKADSLFKQGNYPEALQYYDKSVQKDPKYVRAWIGKGVAFSMLGKLDEALECHEKALKLEPDNFTALNNKCSIFIGLKRFKEAELFEYGFRVIS